MMNSVDPDETASYEPFHLDLHFCIGWFGSAKLILFNFTNIINIQTTVWKTQLEIKVGLL